MDAQPVALSSRVIEARAKINLALHVVGRRPDGYHELDSLVVFAREGDQLRIETASGDRFDVSGPFGSRISSNADNIVLRALASSRVVLENAGRSLPPLHVSLIKNLPPASGIGGGSADAAALLSHIVEQHGDLTGDFRRAALRLGADVPMCLDGFTARVQGVGEVGTPVAIAADIPLLLVNPGVEVSTPAVFAALKRRDNAPLPDFPHGGIGTASTLSQYLAQCRNDLEDAARALAPPIGNAASAIESCGALLARMSGSGATVFGLFDTQDACRSAAERIARAEPRWWVRATTIDARRRHG